MAIEVLPDELAAAARPLQDAGRALRDLGDARRLLIDLAAGAADAELRARAGAAGPGATPVLRVPVPELATGAVVAVTGQRVAAPVGCVVVHHRRSFGQEWSEVRVWVEPERATPPPWPALQLLFGSYYRPTWRRDWSRSHLPPLDFRREQPKAVADQAREELTHLWELPDEGARRGAVLELGSYQVPLLERRVDRLLISIGWQLETLGDWP